MARPIDRDVEEVRARLGEWLAPRIAGGRPVDVSELTIPGVSGYSGETFLFEATWNGGSEKLVARLEPSGETVFSDADSATEFRVLDALSQKTSVPVAKTFGYEADRSWFGVPFYVSQQVGGRVPSDNPPYAFGGWPADEPVETQASMWWSGLDALAKVHGVDWRALGLSALFDARNEQPGAERQLAWMDDYIAWVAPNGPSIIKEAMEWLRAHAPAAPAEPVLCWGDSRIGNQIFLDGKCVAVLDWEMATVGDPEMDLAWFIVMDRTLSEGLNVPRLPGFPGRDETAARYEELTGKPVKHLDWWEIYGALRFGVILMRVGQILLDKESAGMDVDNFALQFCAKLLGEAQA
jgi:aminoglycoside phosphotransferase (APT) family kinase protein